MAARVHLDKPEPTMTRLDAVRNAPEATQISYPKLLLLHDRGEDEILCDTEQVVGQPCERIGSLEELNKVSDALLVGMSYDGVSTRERLKDPNRITISMHALDLKEGRDETLASFCNYEYLYTRRPFFRRDLARYLGFILGQINPHDDLKDKERTTLLSTTFPDIRIALPNLDILSVGADSVELRVDLLDELLPDGSLSRVPSISFVGEQVMLLRQRTELPIIFTTRCSDENGRFPMEDPNLFLTYLHKAIQWGCEYIDIELWLPTYIREELIACKGNSKIISAFHDFSGRFDWRSPNAQKLFLEGAAYGDVVKMIAFVNTLGENYDLEAFRSQIEKTYGHPPFSGLNMGPEGQLSRTLNKVFTPITHPLLPAVAAPGQLSAAQINSKLYLMGRMAKLDLYAIGNVQSTGQAMFFEKCLNELSLPHQLRCIEQVSRGTIESTVKLLGFGGAYIDPPLPVASATYLSAVSDAASAIGEFDSIVVASPGGRSTLTADNTTWKGIRATLTRDFVPSAYSNRSALVLSSAQPQAAAAVFALKSLGIGSVYTIGFKPSGLLVADVQPIFSIDGFSRVEEPFVIISTLSAEKSHTVVPLLRHYGDNGQRSTKKPRGVYLDLANGNRKLDPLEIATSVGWTSYSVADVNAWTMVETLRLLVGQNVPYDFVRLASGRSLYI